MPRPTFLSTRPRHGTRGLLLDLETILAQPAAVPSPQRRRALHWLSAAGTAVALGACGDGSSSTDDSGTSGDTGATGNTGTTGTDGTTGTTGTTGDSTITVSSCSEIPTETAGPYPADGSNGAGGGGGPGAPGNQTTGSTINALTLSGIVRSDIRTSISGAGTTAAGVPLTVRLKLVDTSNSCGSLAGRAIYLWHCDREGNYSLYSSSVSTLDYLRGVQVTDANGEVSFTTVFPGCYSGRWPHIHFEVYSTLTDALDASRVSDYTKVSQLALPEAVCSAVYDNVTGYTASIRNLAGITLTSDNVFGEDQAVKQMATVTGSATDGYVATLVVGVTGG